MSSPSVRRLEAHEVEAALRVLEAAYGAASAGGARARMQAELGEWLAVRADDAVAGVVTANRYGSVAYVAMMAVAPEFRRRGLGTLLVETLLAQLDAEGYATVLLDARREAEGIYGRLGFREIDRTAVYERTAHAPPHEAGSRIDGAFLDRLCQVDARFYGCDRSATLRRLANEPYALALASADAYLMARGPVIGPFAAESSAAAAALLRAALAGRPFAYRAFVPAANLDGAPLFETHGFACARTLAHMSRGAPSPFRRARIFGQASLGHG